VDAVYRRYYEIMLELCDSGLFGGVAHPDSIKCFGRLPREDMAERYAALANALNRNGMYAENSGGLRLNYGADCELGLNRDLLRALKGSGVMLRTASDAHRPSDTGAHVRELQAMIDRQ